jgi:hypothetical protein
MPSAVFASPELGSPKSQVVEAISFWSSVLVLTKRQLRSVQTGVSMLATGATPPLAAFTVTGTTTSSLLPVLSVTVSLAWKVPSVW